MLIIIFLLVSFSNQHQLIVFHWSLNFLQLSRTLLSLLALLNNAVVSMVLILPLIIKICHFFSKSFEDYSYNHIYKWYHRLYDVPLSFLFLCGVTSICTSLIFLSFSLRCQVERLNPPDDFLIIISRSGLLTGSVGCLGFMAYQPLLFFLTPNPFLYK